MEHVVDAVRVDAHLPVCGAGHGGGARDAPVVTSLPLRYRLGLCAEWRGLSQRLKQNNNIQALCNRQVQHRCNLYYHTVPKGDCSLRVPTRYLYCSLWNTI